MKRSRALALSAALSIVLSSIASIASAQVPASRDTTADTLAFMLAPLEVNATRERAAPPPVPALEIAPPALRRTQAANPYDLIRRVGGIEVHEQGQGPGFASDVVVRGFTSDHSQDVLLVIDGVPVNLPVNGHAEGYADWSVLLPSAISSARLIYGTASPLYGDFALGGVLEVFTAADADRTVAGIEGSSYGDLGGWLRTGGRGAAGGHLEAFDFRNNDGWRDNSRSRIGNLLLRGWHKTAAGRIEGGIQGYASRWDSPGFLSVDQFNTGLLDGASDPSDGGNDQRLVAHGRYVHSTGARSAFQASAWGLLSRWKLFLTIPENGEPAGQKYERDQRGGAGAQIEWASTTPHGDFTVGVSGRIDAARFDHGDSEMRAVGDLEESFDARHQTVAAYVRWRENVTPRLGIDAGARFDAVRHSSLDLLETNAAWAPSTKTILSPKLGARYALSTTTSLRASLSRGFRSPAGVLSDASRPPVIAWSSDAGIQYAGRDIDMFVGVFRLDVSHERQLDPVTREIQNTGSSTRQGLNARLVWTASDAVLMRAAFTYNHARLSGFFADEHGAHDQAQASVREGVLASVQLHDEPLTHQVPGVAEYFGSLRLEVRPIESVMVDADWNLNGPFVPIGENEQTGAYSVFNLGGTIRLRDHASLDLSLQNLLNEKYPELRASEFINPGAPRTLRAALRLDTH